MKKLYILVLGIMLSFSGKAFAEVSYGVSAAITEINADGTETEGGENNSGSANNTVIIPSIFVEYAYSDTISVGLDIIPISADVSDKTKKRTDTETSVGTTETETTTSREQKANAELKNHLTLYANYSLNDTLYLKGGVSYVSLETDESLGTGSKYGNEDIYGYLIGVGGVNGNSRIELSYTDYEDISLTSSVARSGVTTNNKIEADLDVLQIKYSYVF